MKEFLEPIAANIWDLFANFCLFMQESLETKWLIIGGIIMVIIAAFLCDRMMKDEYGETNIWLILFAVGFFLAVFFTVFCMGLDNFVHYKDLKDSDDWIIVSITWIILFLLIIISIPSGKIITTLCFVVCAIMAAALFSKFVVGVGILLGLAALGGGSTYVGTFTDRNGNSYDIYKK